MSQAPPQQQQPKDAGAQMLTYLVQRTVHIQDTLPDRWKSQATRFITRAMLTFRRNPDLAACTIESFFHCVVAAAELGFAIDGRLAHAVARKGKACFQLDYKGMIALARRSGILRDAYAQLVYAEDDFDQQYKDGACHFTHTPSLGRKPNTVIGAYAVIVFPDGYWRHEWMSKYDLDQVKNSAASQKGPWSTNEGEMQRKTVLRRLLKTFGDAEELNNALQLEDLDDEVIEVANENAEPAPPKGRTQHARRLSGDMPLPANFDQAPTEKETQPAGTAAAESPKQETRQPESKPYNEAAEIQRQELIASLHQRLSETLNPAALRELGEDLRKSQATLGPDVTADMQQRYQAKLGQVDPAFQPSNNPQPRKRTF